MRRAVLCLAVLLWATVAGAAPALGPESPLEALVSDELGLGLRPGEAIRGPAACTLAELWERLGRLALEEGEDPGAANVRARDLRPACVEPHRPYPLHDVEDGASFMAGEVRQSAAVLRRLATALLTQRQVAPALPLLWRGARIVEAFLRRSDLTEEQTLDYLRRFRLDESLAYTALRKELADGRVQRLALTLALSRKARALDSAAALARRAAAAGGDRADRARLAALRGEIARLSLRLPEPAGEEARARALRRAYGEAARLLDRLGPAAPAQASAAAPDPAAPPLQDLVGAVAAALRREPDSALVELVAFDVLRPGGRRGLAGARIGRAYLALVLHQDGALGAADLGDAAPIDEAAQRLLAGLQSPEGAYEAAARRLHDLVFAPVEPLLRGRRRLLLAPDGALSLVPFAVLSDGRRPLLDRYALSYLTSGRDLLRGADAVARAGRPAVLLADPDFGAAQGATRALPWLGPVPRLPGTRQEAEAISRLLPGAELRLGAAASKAALLAARGPKVLVVSTHGLYLRPAPGGPAAARGIEIAPEGEVSPSANAPPPAPDNPLLRSALILAASPGPRGGGDPLAGLTTALEVSGMDLRGTRLVVLSACESGAGDVVAGEGVFGLRRALLIAGAETLVTSLWRVDDQRTRELMTAYFTALLAGRGRAEALDEAMGQLRRRAPHPYYWAPFLVVGERGPLPGVGGAPGAAPAGPVTRGAAP